MTFTSNFIYVNQWVEKVWSSEEAMIVRGRADKVAYLIRLKLSHNFSEDLKERTNYDNKINIRVSRWVLTILFLRSVFTKGYLFDK